MCGKESHVILSSFAEGEKCRAEMRESHTFAPTADSASCLGCEFGIDLEVSVVDCYFELKYAAE